MRKFLFTYDELAEATGGEWVSRGGGRSANDPTGSATLGVELVSTSTKAGCAGALFVALKGERLGAHEFLHDAVAAGAAAVCVRKSFPRDHIPAGVDALLVDNTLTAFQALAKYHRNRLPNVKIVALTGSSGKTSTKDILQSVLAAGFGRDAVYATEGNTNNHVGVPQNLLRLKDTHKVAIIEMGTNHPGEIAVLTAMAKPDLATIVSIGPAHLEFFGDTDGVAREKGSIFAGLRPDGVAVIPASGPGQGILSMLSTSFTTKTFGDESGADVRSSYKGGALEGSSFTLTLADGRSAEVSWRLRGAHQARNAAAAAAAAMSLGMSFEQVTEALSACEIGGMRMRVRVIRGVTWINDAYNANPDSVKAGLEWLSGFYASSRRVFLALGDMLELGESSHRGHCEVLETARRLLPSTASCEVRLIVVGARMAEALRSVGAVETAVAHATSDEAAVNVNRLLREGDMIYLKGSHSMALEKIESSWEKG